MISRESEVNVQHIPLTDQLIAEWDVLVIGAGPAGLTAACYLARYLRRGLIVHDSSSRALRIPLTHNAPGFPGGVIGAELVARMQEQAQIYGAIVKTDKIVSLRRTAQGFVASGDNSYAARSVILATGTTLNQVELPWEIHEEALNLGCLRYCPVCDGYEATGKAVGVLGSSARGAREALFLREYTDNVTLIPLDAVDLSDAQRAELQSRRDSLGPARSESRTGTQGYEGHAVRRPDVLARRALSSARLCAPRRARPAAGAGSYRDRLLAR